jgi:hypothetical protein
MYSVVIEYVKVLKKIFIPLEKSIITPTRNNYKENFSLFSGNLFTSVHTTASILILG